MRISYWSSDVCSSDLIGRRPPDMGVGGSRISLLAPVRAYAAAAFAADVAARQRDVHPGGARRLDRPGGGGRPRPCYAAPPFDQQRYCQPSAAQLGALPMFHGAGGGAPPPPSRPPPE